MKESLLSRLSTLILSRNKGNNHIPPQELELKVNQEYNAMT